eukprot:1539280-Amphidinium_carterae.1
MAFRCTAKDYGDDKLAGCTGTVPVSCPACKDVPEDKRTPIFNRIETAHSRPHRSRTDKTS